MGAGISRTSWDERAQNVGIGDGGQSVCEKDWAKKDYEITWNNLERSLEAVDEVLGHVLYHRGKSRWDGERKVKHSKLLPLKGLGWGGMEWLGDGKQIWRFKKNLFPRFLTAVICRGPYLAFYAKCFYPQSHPTTQVLFSHLQMRKHSEGLGNSLKNTEVLREARFKLMLSPSVRSLWEHWEESYRHPARRKLKLSLFVCKQRKEQ